MQKIFAFLISRLVWLYLHMIALTSKITWINHEFSDQLLKQYNGFIFAFWHGRQVFFTWSHRNTGYYTLVSQSKDGEYISTVIQCFGMNTVRGSSSRGGAKALIQLKQLLDNNKVVGITPDGPKGPQQSVQQGVIFLAQKTKKPILPITCSYKKKIIFKGWDDYWVPLPFNNIFLIHGKPIFISTSDSVEIKTKELQNELNFITKQADHLAENS